MRLAISKDSQDPAGSYTSFTSLGVGWCYLCPRFSHKYQVPYHAARSNVVSRTKYAPRIWRVGLESNSLVQPSSSPKPMASLLQDMVAQRHRSLDRCVGSWRTGGRSCVSFTTLLQTFEILHITAFVCLCRHDTSGSSSSIENNDNATKHSLQRCASAILILTMFSSLLCMAIQRRATWYKASTVTWSRRKNRTVGTSSHFQANIVHSQWSPNTLFCGQQSRSES